MKEIPLRHRLRLCLAVSMLFVVPQVASAQSPRTFVDGRELIFADVQPIIESSRTLVPLRGFLTALGAEIGWDQGSRTAIAVLGKTKVEATIDSEIARVNDQEVVLDVPARLVADRTVVPLRFFAEELGLAVHWDQAAYAVHVDSGSSGIVSREGSGGRDREEAPPVLPDPPTAGPPDEKPPAEPPAADPPLIELPIVLPLVGPQVVDAAAGLLGLPYAWGGISPVTGFDCSGFIYYLSQQVGVSMPRTSYGQFERGTPIGVDDLQAGDLVFFTTYAPGASHVGVYDGAGSFIHSQNESTGVITTRLRSAYWWERYLGARRIYD